MASLAIVLILVAGHARAQDVTISPRLRAGDEFRLSLVRTRENSIRPQQNGRSRTVVNVRVLSSAPEGVVLEWAPEESILDNPQLAQNPLFAAALQAVRDIRFHLALDADGALVGLANRDDVVPKLQSMVDTIVRELSARVPIEQRPAMLNLVGQVLSPDVLVSSATREAALYFGVNGVSLAVGEEAEVRLNQPSPLGSGVIPATLRVHMESATADSASVVTETAYDTTALQRMTESLAQQAGAPIPPGELTTMPPIQINDAARYVFDRNARLMKEVVVNRRIAVGNMQRSDGWEIRLIEGPLR